MADFSANYAALRRARFDDTEQMELKVVTDPSIHHQFKNPLEDQERLIRHERAAALRRQEAIGERMMSKTTTTRSSRVRRRKLQGWRFGVAASATMTTAVLTTNVILTIWLSARFGVTNGVGTAYEGDCGVVNRWTFWLHVVINILSSILLSASNYTMQCLSAPTRREVDAAHAKGDWLDIGVSGIRNLTRIGLHRRILWAALALSSLPIHLLFNSAVFKTLQANQYGMVLANPAFLDGGGFDNSSIPLFRIDLVRLVQEDYAAKPSGWQKLDPADCITAYGTSFVSHFNNVMAITTSDAATESAVFFASSALYTSTDSDGLPYKWICEDTSDDRYVCDISAAKENATNWTIEGRKVDYCLAQTTEPHCQLQFSVYILLAVIICNMIKSLSMLCALYWQKDGTLVTLGDALASFLDEPQASTRGRCLMSKRDVDRGPLQWVAAHGTLNTGSSRRRAWFAAPLCGTHTASYDTCPTGNTNPPAMVYSATKVRRWYTAVSVRRWFTTLSLCVTTLCGAAVLLSMAIEHLRGSSRVSIFKLGFGAVDPRALLNIGLPTTATDGLVASVLLANLPQAILSCLYLMYNGLYTSMHLSQEWSTYAVQRKPLRVTAPCGEQKSTYFLSLPYTYALPLLIASATLHWLVSQSLFLARISIWNNGVESEGDSLSTVGFSCTPIVVIIVLGSCMLLAAIGTGCRSFASSGIPVAGSCSVAISAACHRPKDDVNAGVLEVKWGEIHGEGTSEVGHCAFTTEEVQDLVFGRAYAGARDGWEGRGGFHSM
ncbi:hypothetical protein LTR97_004189 [Elasticomyces elasticus]|uniref:DUF6536 domain-containing protein n=1 Tax=Elasticomyces elasticus TaxID=574655 RepID=A0AAN7WEY8_9PEZI|nr:hypothetical protein LTR97_004189 [Elasticomyces elasticus]